MSTIKRFISVPYHGDRGEDRWAWGRSSTGSSVCVLCDGASESYDASGWAETLAQNVLEGILSLENIRPTYRRNFSKRLEQWIYQARKTYLRKHKAQHVAEDWLSRASLARGSWSTLLALRISPQGKALTVWTVGDTELFLLDSYRDVLHLPIPESGAFSISPALIGSTQQSSVPQYRLWQLNLNGLHRPRIVLCTDALAAFMLAQPDLERRAWWEALTKAPLSSVTEMLIHHRASGSLTADDYTLLEIQP